MTHLKAVNEDITSFLQRLSFSRILHFSSTSSAIFLASCFSLPEKQEDSYVLQCSTNWEEKINKEKNPSYSKETV